MDVRPNARWALASERTTDMTDLRRCIGSARFGIEAHEAPVTYFPAQPSQKDGLGRMCKPHWNQYTSALRKAAEIPPDVEPGSETPALRKNRRAKAQAEPDLEPAGVAEVPAG